MSSNRISLVPATTGVKGSPAPIVPAPAGFAMVSLASLPAAIAEQAAAQQSLYWAAIEQAKQCVERTRRRKLYQRAVAQKYLWN